MKHIGYVVMLSATLAMLPQPSHAGDFRNLAKIEKLRTINGGKYAGLMEDIEALGRTLDMLGVKGNPGTYDPNGINRAIGLIEAFEHKHRRGVLQFRYVPFILQDVRSISSGLHNSTAIYNCRKNDACNRHSVNTQRIAEERAVENLWERYREAAEVHNAQYRWK